MRHEAEAKQIAGALEHFLQIHRAVVVGRNDEENDVLRRSEDTARENCHRAVEVLGWRERAGVEAGPSKIFRGRR